MSSFNNHLKNIQKYPHQNICVYKQILARVFSKKGLPFREKPGSVRSKHVSGLRSASVRAKRVPLALSTSKTSSGTKKFSALTFENFKYRRFLNGFSPDRAAFFGRGRFMKASSNFTGGFVSDTLP